MSGIMQGTAEIENKGKRKGERESQKVGTEILR